LSNSHNNCITRQNPLLVKINSSIKHCWKISVNTRGTLLGGQLSCVCRKMHGRFDLKPPSFLMTLKKKSVVPCTRGGPLKFLFFVFWPFLALVYCSLLILIKWRVCSNCCFCNKQNTVSNVQCKHIEVDVKIIGRPSLKMTNNAFF
jgi:hypothetical protein